MKPLTIHHTCQIPPKILQDLYASYLNTDDGHFVEVGAFDGFAYSNTFCLAEIGWSGLCIEPQPEAAALCREYHQNHPKVKTVQMAANDTAGELKLYTNGEVSSLVMDENSRQWGCAEDKFILVQCQRLDDILAEHGVQPGFELLVIDVEGAELKVLDGFSAQRWRPKMVIIEAHEKDPSPLRNWKAGPIGSYFGVNRYGKVYSDHINSIFVPLP